MRLDMKDMRDLEDRIRVSAMSPVPAPHPSLHASTRQVPALRSEIKGVADSRGLACMDQVK